MRSVASLSLVLAATLSGCADEAIAPLSDDIGELAAATGLAYGPLDEEAAMSETAYLASLALQRAIGTSDLLNPGKCPEWYGGSYTNDEGRLVLWLAGSKGEKALPSKLRAELLNYGVFFKSSKHSYNKLIALSNKVILALTGQNAGHLKGVTLVGIDDEHNAVIVGLSESACRQEKEIAKSIGLDDAESAMIRFSKFGPMQDCELVCADSLAVLCDTCHLWHKGSVGYRAVNSEGYVGLVTAGHLLDTVKRKLYECTSKQYIGQALNVANKDGHLDAAFCGIVNPDYLPSNKIAYTANPSADTLHTQLVQPGVGTLINMVGMRSRRQSGKVLFSAFVVRDTCGVQQLTNAIVATYFSTTGDSGGIVYALLKQQNKRLTVGISCKVVPDFNGQRVSVCCKAAVINQTFGLQRY